MTSQIKEERLDYMPGGKRTIFQRNDVFSYSMDAVLLAKFVRLPSEKGKIIDLCAGNGAVSLMMTLRTKAKIEAVEIQPLLSNLAVKTMVENQIDDQVRVIEANLLELDGKVQWESYDVVTCNPPYFPVTAEKGKNINTHVSLARHEIACTLEDVIRVASRLVKQKGKLAMVHRPERVVEIFAAMKAFRLEPKRIQYVHPKKDKEANMVLIEAVREGNPGLKTLPPWVVYDDDQSYIKEFKKHYES
ncbi:SAM-dependent methyltransferase [Salipaludibacillus keqinensis]|uniref:SAM-dependent methyltransferase n=1 Tax=Salipaludibacillus keqinensis TaxID=2045207 RepID=A0A323TAC5_9BACI|nr:tRNA1(Val) (adenine(37)-N6)-methyltransferase [Salipaludibacillus keqinensis]PYZ91534.1 SAM-dependent methyltransferase [Salipaludibacillus keqinensis]